MTADGRRLERALADALARLAQRDAELARAQGELARAREQILAVRSDRDRLSTRVVNDRIEFEAAVLATVRRLCGEAAGDQVRRDGVPEGPKPRKGGNHVR